jgi:hypothetical protein
MTKTEQRDRIYRIKEYIHELGVMRPYKSRWRYTKFGICCRVRSASKKDVYYRVTLRTHPTPNCKCSCPDFINHRREVEYACKHIRFVLGRWNEKHAFKRVAALQDGSFLPNADKGLEMIATQPRYAPINHPRTDHLESVTEAISAGYVFENPNWEQSDATNRMRFTTTDAGDLRWLFIRQDRAIAELSGKAYTEKIKRVSQEFGLKQTSRLTNPTNEI